MTSPDRTLGGYLIGPTLGEGGFSKVKLGIDPDTNERVALKILKKNAMTLSEKQRKQVELEIAAMQGIDHVNVVRLHSVDWHAKYTKRNGRVLDVVLVVLELATGGELFDFLSFTGNFSEPIARTYFHQLCAGLRACRDAGIAHRDLKPENLLLGKDFLLKIADFGFARTTSDDALLYSKCGTTGYMAPEMFTGKGYDGFKSDMWSAGVILFIMLAGFPPFQRADMSDWWFNKLSRGKHSLFWKAHRRSCEFSDGFMDLINKILAPDPAERASLEDVMSHPWFTSGDTLSQEELVAEFSRRKAIVEQEKAREAMAAGSSGTRDASSDISSSGAHRSLGDDDDADDTLPHRPPRMLSQLRLDGLDEDGADDEEPEARLLDADADAQDPTDVPPVFDAKLSVPCYTRFYSKSQPSQLRSALSSAFAHMKAQHSVDGFRIKASVATEAGFVSVVCQLFELTECQSSDVFLCQVRRLDGDGLHFRLFYDDLISRVGDFVCLPPDTDVEV